MIPSRGSSERFAMADRTRRCGCGPGRSTRVSVVDERRPENLRPVRSGSGKTNASSFPCYTGSTRTTSCSTRSFPTRSSRRTSAFARSALRSDFAAANLAALRDVWDSVPTSRDEYVSYLLRHGLAHQAWSIQFEREPPPLGKLLNGDFEERTTECRASRGRIADGEGVRARIVDCPDCVDRGSALLLKFDGETNAHYGARVYVPSKPETVYRLKARVKAERDHIGPRSNLDGHWS